MKKLVETFRLAALQLNIENFYVGNLETNSIEKYIDDKKYYQYIGGIDRLPFVCLNILEKKRYADKRTEEYIASICYGDLIPSNRINQYLEKETAEAILIELFEKAKIISEQNRLNITKIGEEYTFGYEEYVGNASFYFVFLDLNLITR